MNNNIQKINCRTAKNMPIADIMANLNIPIEKVSGKDIWYKSPFKLEKTASFKITIERNIWYDFSLCQGGDVIKLIQVLKNCETKEALEFLTEINSGCFTISKQISVEKSKQNSTLKVLNIRGISDKKLIQYMNSRGIFSEQAISFCKEIDYENVGKKFRSIAFENQSGGYEIRSTGFKPCHGKKDISWLKNDGNNLLVFEGFFDFLSYLEMPNMNIEKADYLILNSLVNLRKIPNILENYRKIFLFLDNDEAGNKAKLELKNCGKETIDMSVFYSTYMDLNECLKMIQGPKCNEL